MGGLMLDLGDTEPEDEDGDEMRVRTPTTAAAGRVVTNNHGNESSNVDVMMKDEMSVSQRQAFDEDMMDAALVLCGLGRRV